MFGSLRVWMTRSPIAGTFSCLPKAARIVLPATRAFVDRNENLRIFRRNACGGKFTRNELANFLPRFQRVRARHEFEFAAIDPSVYDRLNIARIDQSRRFCDS